MTLHMSAESALALAMVMSDARYDNRARRMAAEQAIEDLIEFLDETEGDPDLEPWLAGGGCDDDREGGDIDEVEGDELDFMNGRAGFGEGDGNCDAEPSLGAPESGTLGGDYFEAQRRIFSAVPPRTSQERWARGDRKDLEENVEDEGEAANEDGGDILDQPHDGELELFEGDGDCDAEDSDDVLVASSKADRSKAAKGTALDPNHMPPLYRMRVDGACMLPLIDHDALLEFSGSEPCRPGDIVAIFFHRGFVPTGQHQVLVKRLVLDARQGDVKLASGENGVVVEMLNPRRFLSYPNSAILGIHKMTRIVEEEAQGSTVSDATLLAEAAQRMARQKPSDPDEVAIIAPGVARVGVA